MTDAAQKRLQSFIIEYRTNKACADYKYYVSLEEQLRAKYKTAQSKFATYADSHQDLELKSYETKLTDLENEMQNAFNAYTQMKQQVQVAEAKIQERRRCSLLWKMPTCLCVLRHLRKHLSWLHFSFCHWPEQVAISISSYCLGKLHANSQPIWVYGYKSLRTWMLS